MNILCKDTAGNAIEKFYQWDLGQKVAISGIEASGTVHFHICNDMCGDVYKGVYTYSDGSYIVDIPNILLRESKPVLIYIYEEIDSSEAQTICAICIPLSPRPQPADYVYENNYEFVDYDELTAEVNAINVRLNSIGFRQDGDLIQFTTDGSVWETVFDVNSISGFVDSVNGQTGAVVITPKDLGIYVQDDEPENAEDGDIWVDTKSNVVTVSNVYLIDAKTSDTSTIDFSPYAAGDIILVTLS